MDRIKVGVVEMNFSPDVEITNEIGRVIFHTDGDITIVAKHISTDTGYIHCPYIPESLTDEGKYNRAMKAIKDLEDV